MTCDEKVPVSHMLKKKPAQNCLHTNVKIRQRVLGTPQTRATDDAHHWDEDA